MSTVLARSSVLILLMALLPACGADATDQSGQVETQADNQADNQAAALQHPLQRARAVEDQVLQAAEQQSEQIDKAEPGTDDG